MLDGFKLNDVLDEFTGLTQRLTNHSDQGYAYVVLTST